MQKINSSKFIFLILLLPLFLTGCYDRYELDNLAYVIAIGVDPSDEGGGNKNITYQIAVPLKITGENSETGKDTYTTYTVTAPSLSMGNTLVNAKLSKEINLSHVKLILYSEDIAKSSLSGHVNVFMSHAQIRPKVTFAICEGKAEDFLKEVSPRLEVSPARYYELLFSSHNYTSRTAGSELVDFYTSSQSIDRESFATYVKLSSGEKKEAMYNGLAVFKGSKMVGVLEPDLILAHSLLTNSLKKASYSVPDLNEKDRVVSVNIDQQSAPLINVELDGDKPKIKCKLKLHAHLVSSGSDINFYDKGNKDKLTDELNKNLEKEISAYLDKTIKEYESDIAGIGRIAKTKFLTWKEFEDYNWLSKYKNATYEVEVETDLNISQVISHKVPNSEE